MNIKELCNYLETGEMPGEIKKEVYDYLMSHEIPSGLRKGLYNYFVREGAPDEVLWVLADKEKATNPSRIDPKDYVITPENEEAAKMMVNAVANLALGRYNVAYLFCEGAYKTLKTLRFKDPAKPEIRKAALKIEKVGDKKLEELETVEDVFREAEDIPDWVLEKPLIKLYEKK